MVPCFGFSPKNVHGDLAINLYLFTSYSFGKFSVFTTALWQLRFYKLHWHESFEVFRNNYEILHHILRSSDSQGPQFSSVRWPGYSLIRKSLSSHIQIYMYWTLAHLMRVVPKHRSLFRLLLLVTAIFWPCYFLFPWPSPVSAPLRRLPALFPVPSMSEPEAILDRGTRSNHRTTWKSSNNRPK